MQEPFERSFEGYSDPTDRAQEDFIAACNEYGIKVTMFHGRGGSIGRGGGSTYLAIQSQPPGSVTGTLRSTEQGEMVQVKIWFATNGR